MTEQRRDFKIEYWNSHEGSQRFSYRVRARNGRIVATPGERYHNRGDMLKIVDRLYGPIVCEEVSPPSYQGGGE